jgi:predicted RNase H-like HicB family nuclease
MSRYGIVIERGAGNYSAYVPDLPGCVSTGSTIEELRRNIQEAIELHIEGLRRDGDPIPQPTTLCEYIEAAAA